MKRVAQVVLLAAATALILAPVASGVNQPSVNNALQADGGAPPPIPPIPTMGVPDGGAPPPIPPIPTMRVPDGGAPPPIPPIPTMAAA